MESRHLRVLQSLGVQSGPVVLNPYTKLFTDAVAKHVEIVPFSWLRALSGRYDLFHIHWPEHLIRARGLKGVLKPLLFAALLFRLRVTRTPIVRTVHNLSPHEQGSLIERSLMRKLDDGTAVWIVMNSSTPTPDPDRTVLTPHGHYRDWYHDSPASSVTGRVLYFGGIRDYKGVDQLIHAFTEMEGEYSLEIAGNVSQAEVRSEIESLAKADARISSNLRFLSDAELLRAISASEVVVLPYRNLHNSGSVLLALSLNRPVIVPETPSTRELEREFGAAWVQLYAGNLTGTVLSRTIEKMRGAPREDQVDTSLREWPDVAIKTVGAYRLAVRVTTSGANSFSSRYAGTGIAA